MRGGCVLKFQWLLALVGLLLSTASWCGDISYIAGDDEETVRFNHEATQAFIKGTDLLQAIEVGNGLLAHSSDKGRVLAIKQLVATFYTFAGRYDKAAETYPSFSQPAAIAALAKEQGVPRFVDAASSIAAMAQDRRAVFINENHGAPITRLLPLELLPKLRAEGFQYLALETLNRSGAAITHGCVGLADRDLCQRGYALDSVTTGIYSHDPVYGALIREAIALGFHLVAYDVFDVGDDRSRDAGEASNLANIYSSDPSAKVLVIAGFDHVAKEDTNMAMVFKRITQIDPLTIDQAALLGLDPKLWGAHAAVPLDRASVVFMDGVALSTRPGAMDVSVYRPPFATDRQKARWLALDGRRVQTSLHRPCTAYPCLLTARRVGEPTSVPEDRIFLEKPGDALLYLAPGRYAISAETLGATKLTSVVVQRHSNPSRPTL
jgi:hypothetical protein